jgi:hypothetical protein
MEVLKVHIKVVNLMHPKERGNIAPALLAELASF